MEKAVGEATSRTWALRGSNETGRSDGALPEKPLAASQAPANQGPPLDIVVAAPARKDWSAALDLIQEATEAIRMSEERVEELERAAEEQETRMRSEYALLRDQLQMAQREIEAAYARAAVAEKQAQDAHEWLARLNSAITQGFGRSVKPPQS
jgi:hypothetical protein